MAKRDYYEMLGRRPDRLRGGTQERLPAAGHAASPGPQPGRQGGRAAVQGGQRGLRDPARTRRRRAAYDQFGHQAFEGGMAGAAAAAPGPGSTSPASPTSSTICSATSWAARRRPGAAAAAAGPRRRPALQSDDHARGGVRRQAGADPRADRGRLRGLQRHRQRGRQPSRRLPDLPRRRARCARQQGFFTVERTCPTCQGTGRVIKNPCRACGGSGGLQREKTLAVNIPAGVEDGTRIRLSGEGEAGMRGGAAGRSLHLRQRGPAPRCSGARAATSSAGCRSRWPRRPLAARSRCRRSRAGGCASRFPPGTQAGKQIPPARARA